MTVKSLTSAVHEDRALETLANREVESPGDPRRQRHRDDLATFAGNCEGPMTSLQAQRVNIRAEGFGDAQPVQRQQRHQRVVPCGRETRSDEQRAELVAIQARGV
jgi:hypothetical protein